MTATKIRNKLWLLGYRPVAICNGLKFPIDLEWTERARRNPPALITEGYNWRHDGTGILCDGLQAIDIDLNNEDHVIEIAHWCLENLGDAPIRYRIDSPRILLLYQAAEGSPPKSKIWNQTDKKGVEVLGHGNQFFADGRHPDGALLKWMGEDLGPDNWARDELAAITLLQVEQLLDFSKQFVGDTSKKSHRLEPVVFEATMDAEEDIENVRRTLEAIPNLHCDYDWWLVIGMASWRATGGSGEGYELWRAWSSQNHVHRDQDTEKVWRSFIRNPPTRVNFATLVYQAKQFDPNFIPRSPLKQFDRDLLNRYKRKPASW